MDDLSRLIFDYLQLEGPVSKTDLNSFVIKHSPYKNKETDIIARLIVLMTLFEEHEEYEICHSIKQILNQYETKSS